MVIKNKFSLKGRRDEVSRTELFSSAASEHREWPAAVAFDIVANRFSQIPPPLGKNQKVALFLAFKMCNRFDVRAVSGGVLVKICTYVFAYGYLIIYAMAWTHSAYAGNYELTQGNEIAVCQAYRESLNQHRPSRPMLCERSISSDAKQIAKPEWKRHSLDEIAEMNVNEYDRALLAISPNSPVLREPKGERVRKAAETIKSKFNDKWPLSVWTAYVDLDNDGKQELVRKDVHGICNALPPPAVVLRSLEYDRASIALKGILESAMRRPVKTPAGMSAQKQVFAQGYEPLGAYMYPDLFQFNNEWYLDVWATNSDARDPSNGRLYVFVYRQGQTRNVCEFEYRANAR